MHAPFPYPMPAGAAPASSPPGAAIRLALAAIALLALLVPAWLVAGGEFFRARQPRAESPPPRIVSKAVVPVAEPLAYQSLSADEARRINARIPFSAEPVRAARPFRLVAPPLDRARAIDCLAAAVLYEAGDDPAGERAVAQVVLNRVRHPAFAKTVCGVVFEGAERPTGCQFTFTCDGAMDRHVWPAAAWARARLIANAALDGAVDARVGYATHYHTDWVVPYWSARLDKVTAVGSHLFFRWAGWWGTPGAFSRRADPVEPVIPQLATLSPAHRGDVLLADVLTPAQRAQLVATAIAKLPPPAAGDANVFLVTIDAGLPPDDLPRLAVQSCGARRYCKFLAWSDAGRTPKKLPIRDGDIAALAFSYLRDRDRWFDKMLWNCRVYPRPAAQCMKRQLPLAPDPVSEPADNASVAAG